LRGLCRAEATGQVANYPQPRMRRAIPLRRTWMLAIYDGQGRVALCKRPPVGVWAGLWSLPECPLDGDAVAWCRQEFGVAIEHLETWPVRRHCFSHFQLDIQPLVARARYAAGAVHDVEKLVWCDARDLETIGMPAPVSRLLTEISHSD
jgi:A/G-specific adenine glycosylase